MTYYQTLQDSYGDDTPYEYEIPNEQPEMVCTCCGKSCYVVTLDEGIDGYEYGSFIGVDHKYAQVSACCADKIIPKMLWLKQQEEGDECQT